MDKITRMKINFTDKKIIDREIEIDLLKKFFKFKYPNKIIKIIKIIGNEKEECLNQIKEHYRYVVYENITDNEIENNLNYLINELNNNSLPYNKEILLGLYFEYINKKDYSVKYLVNSVKQKYLEKSNIIYI